MEIVRRDSVPAFVAPDKAIIRELAASRNSSAKKQSLAEATIAVGDSVTEHYHKVTEEFYYILSGAGLMKINDEEEQVSPGDTVIILPGMRHKITNNGTVPLVLLAVVRPSGRRKTMCLPSSAFGVRRHRMTVAGSVRIEYWVAPSATASTF